MLHHVGSVGEKEVGVGLQVDDAAVDEKLAVTLHEIRRRETLAGILHLRVGEGEPDLLHLVLGEESLDDLDVGAEESHILQSFVDGLGGPCPHAGSFDVDADEVDVGVALGKFHSVFPFAAAELQHNGILVVEILLVPMTLHIKGNMFHYRIRVLEHVLIGIHIGELRQLAFSHALFIRRRIWVNRRARSFAVHCPSDT